MARPLRIEFPGAIYHVTSRGNEDYSQAGNLYRLMNDEQKAQLIGNLVGALKPVPREIQVRQSAHFYKADPDYGRRVAQGLGIGIDEIGG